MMLREVIALLMNDEKPLGCYVIEFDASSLLRSLYSISRKKEILLNRKNAVDYELL